MINRGSLLCRFPASTHARIGTMFGMSRMMTEVLKHLAASLAVSSISSGSEALTLLQRLLLSMTFPRVNTHYCTAKVRQYVPTAV